MEGFQVLFSNYYINIGAISWLIAQVLKTILTLVVTREFVPERLVGAGGMPSAHSALVCSVAIAIEKKMGFSSPEFALALVLAAIVMYDAMGVRRAAGEQAKVLNQMIQSMSLNIREMVKKEKKRRLRKYLQDRKKLDQEEIEVEEVTQGTNLADQGTALLKELLGHTPLEVLAGAILGVVVATVMPVF